MTTVTSYPGVYIEEVGIPSISVQAGATAVPVFPVSRDFDKDNWSMAESEDAAFNYARGAPRVFFPRTIRINSWLEFVKALTHLDFGHPYEEQHNPPIERCVVSSEVVLHMAVKAFFLNGGNYCYLVPIRNEDTSNLEEGDGALEDIPAVAPNPVINFPGYDLVPGIPPADYSASYMETGSFLERIQKLDDVTMIVEAGVGMHRPRYIWQPRKSAGDGASIITYTLDPDNPPQINYSDHYGDDYSLYLNYGFGDEDKLVFDDAVTNLLSDPSRPFFAVLDGPSAPLRSDNTEWWSNPSFANHTNAATYYPYLLADWAVERWETSYGLLLKRNMTIPPSAAVAGAYCRNDRERGVWKAPANMVLQGGMTPQYRMSDTVQGIYNTASPPLNVIRWFTDRGAVIYGARTMTHDGDTAWRYVPVRRLFNSAERDIKNTMQTMVFEPNNQATWEKTRGAIDNYLRSLWKQGALLGETEKEAYFVQVGLDITMTQEQIDAGQMIVKVGMAAVRPAEFIILQFTQDVQ